MRPAVRERFFFLRAADVDPQTKSNDQLISSQKHDRYLKRVHPVGTMAINELSGNESGS
jgi:hypothetical protein